jgi:putative ABC transport system permease protein
MRPSVIPWLYWLRLRTWPLQELLALCGIAVGVALVFAVQVSNSSVTGSVKQTIHGITGTSEWALTGRDQNGFPESTLSRVKAQPAVAAAAPIILARASVSGPRRQTSVALVGVTTDFADLNARLVRGFGGEYGLRLTPSSLLLPESMARTLGVGPGDVIRVDAFGRTRRVHVAATVGRGQVGTLADSPVVVGSLPFVQSLTGLADRVTHILVTPKRGRGPDARKELEAIAADRLDVVPSDNESRLISQAAGPNEQSTGMFAAISMVVGVLFAFNAMLLTVPERRRTAAEMRTQGFSRAQLTTVLLFESLSLGVVASLAGLLLGDQLSRHVFEAEPGYLSFAFPVGHARLVSATDVAIAFGGGIVATLVAISRPLFDIYSTRPVDEQERVAELPSEGPTPQARRALLAIAGALVAFAAAVLIIRPSWAHAGIVALGIALLLVLPSTLAGALNLAERASHGAGGRLLFVAVFELRANATRAIALAATGALAIFGSVAIEGAHRDLQRGLDDFGAAYVGTADVWVSSGGDENALLTTPFTVPPALRELAASPVIQAARLDRGGFIDIAGRRVWLIARQASQRPPIPAGEVTEGNLAQAAARLREGGAVIASSGLADHLGVDVGGELHMPTPTGTVPLRLAAKTNNLGWSPGTLLLSAEDYKRLWHSNDVTAMEIDLNPGTTPAAGQRLVQSALAGTSLTVETAQQRLDRIKRLTRQGLDRLSQISTLMLVAAALAMAAAMSAAVWQQRRRLAVLRSLGFTRRQVWRILLIQSTLVLTVGAFIGAVFGLAGQVLATRWVSLTTGFPSIFSPAVALAGVTFLGVSLVALAAISAPGLVASRVSPSASFD